MLSTHWAPVTTDNQPILSDVSSTPNMQLFKTCKSDSQCPDGWFCFTDDMSCQDCGPVCGYDVKSCNAYCTSIKDMTPSPTQPKRHSNLLDVVVTAVTVTSTTMLQQAATVTPTPIVAYVRDNHMDPLPLTTQSPALGPPPPLTPTYVAIIILLLALLVIIVLLLIFAKLYQMLKRQEYYNDKSIEAGASLVANEQKTRHSSESRSSFDTDYQPSIPQRARHVSISTTSTDNDHECCGVTYQARIRHASTSTSPPELENELLISANQKRTRHASTATTASEIDNGSSTQRVRHASTSTSCDLPSDVDSINILLPRQSSIISTSSEPRDTQLDNIPEEDQHSRKCPTCADEKAR